MLTVELNALKFHSYHGLYEGESVAGSDYEVSLFVTYQAPASFVRLSDTIDYGALFNIVQQAMQHPVPLLEDLADRILKEIKITFPKIRSSVISIYKLQAPIPQLQGKVGVTLHKKYDA